MFRANVRPLLVAFALALCIFATAGGGCSKSALDLPAADRQQNWDKQGSCAWACLVTLLRADGDNADATYIRQHCGGPCLEIWIPGEDSFRHFDLTAVMDGLKIRHAETLRGDPAWLRHACDIGSGCIVPFDHFGDGRGGFDDCPPGGHAILLVTIDESEAVFIDPNQPRLNARMPTGAFVNHWRTSGGWSVRLRQWWELP